jgi:hypothetical protein
VVERLVLAVVAAVQTGQLQVLMVLTQLQTQAAAVVALDTVQDLPEMVALAAPAS